MLCNNHLRQWLVTQMVPSHCLWYKFIIVHSYLHIKYNSFQVLCTIYGSKVGIIYNALNRAKMLCYYRTNSVVQCNYGYTIAGCDSLYDLKRQRCYVFLPFQVYQEEIDISIRGCRDGHTCTNRPSNWLQFLVSMPYKLLLNWNIDRK